MNSDGTADSQALTTGLAINEQIKKLNDGVELLAKQLQTQVREQHNSLLLEARNASKLSTAVELVNCHMNQLEMGAERLISKINVPYGLLQNQTRALARLHDISHILRQSNRFLQLFQKLTADSKDITAQATILFELELLIDNEQLNHIDFIREERIFTINLKQRITSSAHHDLLSALKKTIDEEKAVKSLQVFTNLQVLPKYIDDLLEIYISDIKHSLKECFAGVEVKKLSARKVKMPKVTEQTKVRKSPGTTQNLNASQQFSTKFWAAIEWLFEEEIFDNWKQINFLTKCLKNVSHQVNCMSPVQTVDIEKGFCDRLNELLKKSFTDCQSHIKQCLVQDLPKLLQLMKQLQSKCENRIAISEESIFTNLEAGYLEQCTNNLKATLIIADVPNQVIF